MEFIKDKISKIVIKKINIIRNKKRLDLVKRSGLFLFIFRSFFNGFELVLSYLDIRVTSLIYPYRF